MAYSKRKRTREVVIDSVQLKRGTSISLKEQNPILLDGEPCIETDTGKVKFGCDLKRYNDLPYSSINTLHSASHERLRSLFGGDNSGRYHLTREQYQKLLALLDSETPPVDSGIVTYAFTVQAKSIAGVAQKEFVLTAVK